ncbi:MAG: zinc-dependent alcohol dehydrogenase family protein [Betaproteobacteria bacterium]|nr:zinc-dependent alcohol dehydrogenase family protein [Betaproteobacteria bacterium]
MQALRATYETRGPVPQDVIRPVTVDLPAPAAGQALVAVLAAPINPSDVLMLTGGYGMLPPLPAVGGSEGVGRVVQVGPDVSGLQPGQRVLLPAGSGTWASHLIADARRLVPLPEDADPLQMAMLTVNPATASLLLSEFVTLAAGDWVIQNVANSGVGGYLIQLARQRGFRTVNVVRREGAVAAVQDQGGDVVLVDGDDLHHRVKQATGGAPVRLGIDAVGGAATERLARCLAEGGTLVNYGLMSGESCVVSAQSFVFNDLTLRGFWLAKWFRVASRDAQKALYGELTRALAAGHLKARIHATYPVQQIQKAVAAAAAGERDGKILIVPGAA